MRVGKGGIDALSEVVPRSIATSGVREQAAPGRRRPDRPLGNQGIDLLTQVPLFAGLSRRHLKRLAEHADIVSFNDRETIVESGQPGGTFYVILEGEVKVVRGGKTVGRLDPGDFFGEISLLDGGPRTATVVADSPVTAIRIFKRSFDKVVSQDPGVASKILAVVARRLRDAERSISS
ncbi:MAG: Crp/Fnr family transcriptional regulator [Actinomycetota bacterium]